MIWGFILMPIIKGHHNRKQIFLDVVLLDLKRDAHSSEDYSELLVRLESAKALIDTGATATSITPNAAAKLGLRMAGRQNVLTAGGPQYVPYYVFYVGFVYPEGVNPIAKPATFHVLPDPVTGAAFLFNSSPFDILLGMDVISQGDLFVRRDGNFSFEF